MITSSALTVKLKHDSLALFLTENCSTSAHHAAALLIHRVSEWSRKAALLLLSVRLWSFRDSRGKYRSRGPDSCKRTQHKHTRLWIINWQNWSKAYYRSNDISFTQLTIGIARLCVYVRLRHHELLSI